MNWRPKWSTVTIALAVIAALAIASPVLGVSKSIKKAVKKEVTKQVANATGPQGSQGPQGAQGIQGAPGLDATRLFAFIRDPGIASDAVVVDYGSGVTSVTEPSSSDGQYVVTFNRSVQNCIVQASAGVGDPLGGTTVANTSVPLVNMSLGTAAQVEVDWKRPDNDADFGVDIDTSFFISAFC